MSISCHRRAIGLGVPAALFSLVFSVPAHAVRIGQPVPEASRKYDAVCAFARVGAEYLPANNAFASGVLIGPRSVVIAAHAVSDEAGRTPLQQGFNQQLLGPGHFAVRFRRRPDGGIGSPEQGAASFVDIPISSIAVSGFDIAVATLAAPVDHIPPMPVTFNSVVTRTSRVTLAGWGFDGPAHGVGSRGRLNTGTAGYTGPDRLGAWMNWRGQYGNLYDSGGAVMIEGDCGEPVLIGVMTGPGNGTGLLAMQQQVRAAASSVLTCDATAPEHLYTGPMDEDPPPGVWAPEPVEVTDPRNPVGQPWGGAAAPDVSANRSSRFGALKGPHAVGRAVFDLTDAGREETLTKDRRDARRVSVHVWFPALSLDRAGASAFTRDPTAFAARYAALTKRRAGDVAASLRTLAPRSWDSAPPDRSTPTPMVVLVHDLDRAPEFYASTAEDLASSGFLVLCVNHTFESVSSTYLPALAKPGPEARAIVKARPDLYPPAFWRLAARWAGDIDFAVRAVAESGLFNTQVERVCVVGHGVGGSVAAAIAAGDDRVAGVALLGADVPGSKGTPRVPTLLIDLSINAQAPTPPENPDRAALKRLRLNATQYAAYRATFIEWSEAKRLATLFGGGRVLVGAASPEVFSDAALIGDASTLAPNLRVAINARLLEFAEVTLREGAPALLAGSTDGNFFRTIQPWR